jgi:hypothetical protein
MMPPDLERLREAQGKPIWPRYPSEDQMRWILAHADAIDFLLSLFDEGGRLVVETPCEHGTTWTHWELGEPSACEEGSRRVVWPTDKEEG